MAGNKWTIFSALLLVATIAGCGSSTDPNQLPVFPVKGQIAFRGKTPSGALVVLHPKNSASGIEVRPSGHVRDDGTFSVTSYKADDGAPSGEYAITVQWQKTIKNKNGDLARGPNEIPKKYSLPNTSPLAVKIAEGENKLPPIVLK